MGWFGHRFFYRSLALSLLLHAVSCLGDESLQPTAQMHTETLYMVRCLSGIHYDRKPISAIPRGKVLDTYLEDLDPQHMFFLQSDVDDIHARYDLTLDIFLNSGSVKPGFSVYELFRKRANGRLDWVDRVLQSELNIADEEYFEPDRKGVAWSEGEEALDEIWRRRLEFDLLNELLLAPENARASESGCAESAIGHEGAQERLRRRYGRFRSSINDVEPYHVQELFLNSVAELYDPHSSFLSAATWEDFQTCALTNSFMGIGAVLQDDDGYCKIVEIYAGSPAERSGMLHVGDRILAIQQDGGEPVDIIGMRLNRAVRLIKGPKGTAVTLHLQPADGDPSERKVVTLVRDEIQLTAQRARARVYEVPDSNGRTTTSLGYVRLPAFYGGDGSERNDGCCADLKELLIKLGKEDVRGLVLDLRGNGGGLLDEAVAIAGLFLGGGPVVQVRDGDGRVQLFAEPDREVFYGGPLVLLTSKQSASASEILAGALQDHRRALIVGDRSTYGKGSVQALLPMNHSFLFLKNGLQLGTARITIQKWYRPSGDSIQRRGVPADIAFPSTNDALPFGEADNEHALPWDFITGVTLRKWGDGAPCALTDGLVRELRARSLKRRSEPEWQLLEEQVAHFTEKVEQKKFSFAIDDRKRQKEEERAYRAAMEERIKVLSEKDYVHRDVLLSVATEEGTRPRRPTNWEEDDGTTPSKFDVPLRESLRILMDWLGLIEDGYVAIAAR
ncbi:MAG: carboxy terminal-processing peptidase [Puniceicoccales bacterium]|jgi:carboxyl-terminal processing protease|nr:carboxy terminal-processing peptidase [Puniceicoccales bacterium]